jgi:hypothetical protein
MDPEKLEVKDIYSPLVDLAIHSQENKLNLFSSFLFFQSILLLAWATVWQMSSVPGRRLILLAFSLFGGLISIMWAGLGSDYADSARQLFKSAANLEKYFPPEVACHPMTERENTLASQITVATQRKASNCPCYMGFCCSVHHA